MFAKIYGYNINYVLLGVTCGIYDILHLVYDAFFEYKVFDSSEKCSLEAFGPFCWENVIAAFYCVFALTFSCSLIWGSIKVKREEIEIAF